MRSPGVIFNSDLPETSPLFHKPVPVPWLVQHVHAHLLNTTDPECFSLHLAGEVIGEGAGLAGEDHVDLSNIAFYPYLLDEPEIHDIDTNLGIDHLTQCFADLILTDEFLAEYG